MVGADHAFLIGLLAGLCNLVPYLGPLAGTALGVTLVAISGPAAASGALIGGSLLVFAVAQLVDNFFTQPVVFANRVHAHPLEIFPRHQHRWQCSRHFGHGPRGSCLHPFPHRCAGIVQRIQIGGSLDAKPQVREMKFTGAEKLFTAVLRLLFLPNFESRIHIRDHASKQPF